MSVVQQLLAFLTNTFVGPIYATGFTLFYYDQRVRKEGYDIERMMQAAGMSPSLPAVESNSALETAAPVDRGAGMNEPLHPLTLAEILDRTAQIYRSRFLVFFGIGAIPAGTVFVFAAGVFAFMPWMGVHTKNGATDSGFADVDFLISLWCWQFQPAWEPAPLEKLP